MNTPLVIGLVLVVAVASFVAGFVTSLWLAVKAYPETPKPAPSRPIFHPLRDRVERDAPVASMKIGDREYPAGPLDTTSIPHPPMSSTHFW